MNAQSFNLDSSYVIWFSHYILAYECQYIEFILPLFDKKVKILPLKVDFVKAYLGKTLVSDVTLYKILTIPMYLKMYCASSDGALTSKGQLLYKHFFKRLIDIVVSFIALPFVLLAVLIIALLAVLATVLFFGIRSDGDMSKWFGWMVPKANNIQCKDSFTVSDKGVSPVLSPCTISEAVLLTTMIWLSS